MENGGTRAFISWDQGDKCLKRGIIVNQDLYFTEQSELFQRIKGGGTPWEGLINDLFLPQILFLSVWYAKLSKNQMICKIISFHCIYKIYSREFRWCVIYVDQCDNNYNSCPRLLIWQGSTASSSLCTVTLVSIGRNSGSVSRSFFIVNTEKMQVKNTVIILSFLIDRSGQTVQTQIRLLSGYTVCNSGCIF